MWAGATQLAFSAWYVYDYRKSDKTRNSCRWRTILPQSSSTGRGRSSDDDTVAGPNASDKG